MVDLKLEDAAALTAGGTMWSSVAVPSADIVAFAMSDGPMGIASGKVDERDIARLSPCATLLGASWDRDLVRRIGALVGQEAVEREVDAVLAPNINLARSPLAGRAFEYFSEDPLLTGILGGCWIAGLQSTGTASVAKHLVCNDSETARDTVDIQIDERTLREIYLLPFEYAADAGCFGMLAAYNRVNGDYCAEQYHVMTEIVKGDWNYRGAIMSDWFGTHSTAPTLNAGLDLEMPGPFRFLGPKAAEAVAAGDVPQSRVDDAAARVAGLAKNATGAKSRPYTDAEARSLLAEAAAAGFVLLKNEGDILPLAPAKAGTVAIIGPNAAAPCFQGGTFAKISVRPDLPTPEQTVRARYEKDATVLFAPGVDPAPRLPFMAVSPAQDIGDGCTSGMTLEYFASSDCSGTPMTRETRDTNSLVWFTGMHDQADFANGGSIRASGIYRAAKDGAHAFHLGATGKARMFVDGEEIVATTETPPGDTMGVLKSGDSESTSVTLTKGQSVEIVVEFPFEAARVHGLWYGVREPGSVEQMLSEAEDTAARADTVFLFVGETSDSSVESKDRKDTLLPELQLRLIERVSAANPRTVVIANVGHAYDASWEDGAAAHLAVWYPGEGFADAIAAVLAGDVEPGGRMPVSIAQSEADYPALGLQPDADGKLAYDDGTRVGYRGIIGAGKRARHTLGAGQGYARFDWHDARAEDGGLSLRLSNTHDRAGSEVVQVYRDAPETALVGFAKIMLDPGEEGRVTVPLTRRAFASWQDDGWRYPEGECKVRVARHAEDDGISLTLDIGALPPGL
ncbi:glycoside hydrolase family 3 C-terminal domain-containing protein [uncultured Croceicoccus sp.]|uniref:glycoside hydrolase family 3 protein n=1 Tax=uncultured Croceicoccus sp. TaxID=1295329 RepID=UPI0026153082|nr:glycoside hydrolase family 3 C-terminal domain-containing protein [uncultured Croceicoccus sp.]